MTYTEFLTTLRGLTVAGVKRKFNGPPNQLSTADLPAQYPRLPDYQNNTQTMSGGMGLATLKAEIAVVIEAVGQNYNYLANFDAAVAMLDAMQDALSGITITAGLNSWTLRQEITEFGATPYWVLVAAVEAAG